MLRGQMRFAKQRQHAGFRMSPANLRDLRSGMAVTRADFPHIAAGLQINTIDGAAMFPGLAQKASERLPVIASFRVIAYPRAELIFTDFTAQPFVENILITAESHLQRQHHRPVALRQLSDE